MELKKTLVIAILLSLIGIIAWETYWRSQGYSPNLDDNKDLWAVQRANVNTASNTDVLLLGSSRVLFDIQLDEWEQKTGTRPVQLATAGASPLPIFSDIVNNSDFTGTIVLGVTPPLFFSTTFPLADPWKRAQSRVDHFYERTYAQRLNHLVSIPLQQNLVLMSTSEEKWASNIDLKTLVQNIKIGNRIPEGMPPFNRFDNITLDRNTTMTKRAATDTAFANTIKRVWGFFGKTSPPPDKESTIAFFLNDAEKFIAKGGNLILLRCPSTGGFRAGENQGVPKDQFWDELISKTDAKAYHFEEYTELKGFECPEWSHLSAKDAKTFTNRVVQIMQKDGALTNLKIN